MNFRQSFATIALAIAALSSSGTALAADGPRQLSLGELREWGFAAVVGKGRINGKDLDVLLLNGRTPDEDLRQELITKLAGHYTVRVVDDAETRTLLVADVRSKDCPTCFKAGFRSLRAIFDRSVSLTFQDVPGAGTLVYGSGVGALAAVAMQRGELKYEGSALPGLPAGAQLLAQSSFDFNGTRTSTANAALAAAPEATRTLFVEALSKEGFLPLPGNSLAEDTASRSVLGFRRGQTVVHLSITAGPAGSSKVVVHEVTVP